MKLTGFEIRNRFLDFFRRHDHTIVKSSSLIPRNDPTLLFTNAGMVQFKEVFIGARQVPYQRAASCQKCVRAGGKHNDLENVGRTARHHTFFEMLGNFSFGDYFKEKAIEYSWDFLVNEMGLPTDRLWVTVYREDEEAFGLWQRLAGLPAERMVRLGEKDNFWAMGDTGPCGPCSEIVIDQGEAVGCGKADCRVGCECDRYLELWNLVFMQYERFADGTIRPLPRPSIDTGVGLERLSAVLQGGKSNFECDLLFPIIARMEEVTERRYGEDGSSDISFRVVADHARAVTFLLADGVIPANESRGYVLRRILRRGLRHGMKLGLERPFLFEITGTVVDLMADAYPELEERREQISRLSLQEEERFIHTLRSGLPLVEEELASIQSRTEKTLAGEKIFKFYDTYGFPIDLLSEIAGEKGIGLDEEGFQREMEAQRTRGRASWQSGKAELTLPIFDAKGLGGPLLAPTEFIGYQDRVGEATVQALMQEGKPIEEAEGPSEVEIILDRTPFYAEAGGQVGDRGWISWEGGRAEVLDTPARIKGIILHRCKMKKGRIRVGCPVTCQVDEERRQSTANHHTATHLLQAVLRQVLGDHVKQSGSLVAPDRLRFDFSHFSPLKDRELQRIEDLANAHIRSNTPLEIEEKPLEEALKLGAIAIFDEKYGEMVRVVSIPGVSMELCGGTHVRATGELGLLQVISEGGVAAGIRRIEAVAGGPAWDLVEEREELLKEAARRLKVKSNDLLPRIDGLMQALRDQEAELSRIQGYLALQKRDELLEQKQIIEGIEVISGMVDFMGPRELRHLSDLIRDKMGTGAVVLAAPVDDRVHWVVGTSTPKGLGLHAGILVNEVAQITGGKGGGRPDLAEGSGKDRGKVDQALESVPSIIRRLVSQGK
jgi:alanyl-tRNA synthetase